MPADINTKFSMRVLNFTFKYTGVYLLFYHKKRQTHVHRNGCLFKTKRFYTGFNDKSNER